MEMKVVFLVGAAAVALTLSACDAGAPAPRAPPTAAVQAAAQAGSGGGGASPASYASYSSSGPAAAAATPDPRDAPVPMVNGQPLWAANRRHTAEENAAYQFTRNGPDFGAASQADYVARAHAFATSPPAGVERIQRSNGDALLYDARTNTFEVVARNGAPRTMFKPRDGLNYWRQQQAREAARTNGHGGNDDDSQG